MSKRPDSKLRKLIFAVLPALLLLALAEVGARFMLAAEPMLRSLPLGPEQAGLFRTDSELFWSLAARLDRPFLGQQVVTNSLGLRSPEVVEKRDGEFRILSLGESSTFGSGVAGDQTYTAQLVPELQVLGWGDGVTAINAGVPAYSSFQSLKYLEQRGFALEPDLVLFYHEVNDYLPSSVRDSSQNEIGVTQTDWQRWEAMRGGGVERLARSSALVRLLRMRIARARIESFDAEDFRNSVADIGLPGIGIPPRLVRIDGDQTRRAGIEETALVPRVTPAERLEILKTLLRITRESDVGLLVIHPSYRDSQVHRCVLTDFVERHGLPWVEARAALHPPGMRRGALYRDSWHPVAEGHARLARLLAAEIDGRVGGRPD